MQFNDVFALVIEPSNLQRGIITNRLRSFGIENIDEYETGQAALEAMRHQPPDIVISAMHLPDMTGTEVVNSMRQEPALEAITFILISSETHYRFLEPIRQAGAIALLPKPFSQPDLGKALTSTLHYISDLDNPGEAAVEEFENLKVLLVDDSNLSRKYLRQILDNVGVMQIVEATDGAEALQLLQADTFDLIITDYNMPNIDGKEMVEHIRTHDDQPAIPVMMVTSEQNESRLAAIQSAGVSALCSKPLSYDMMKQLIQRLVFEF